MEKKRFTLEERIAYYEKKLESNYDFQRWMKLNAEWTDRQSREFLKNADADRVNHPVKWAVKKLLA